MQPMQAWWEFKVDGGTLETQGGAEILHYAYSIRIRASMLQLFEEYTGMILLVDQAST